MSLGNRMVDAEFNVRAQLCAVCKNEQTHKFDNAHPEKPTMTCKVLGDIPKDIGLGKSYKCEYSILDEEKYAIYKDVLPKDFNFSK